MECYEHKDIDQAVNNVFSYDIIKPGNDGRLKYLSLKKCRDNCFIQQRVVISASGNFGFN